MTGVLVTEAPEGTRPHALVRHADPDLQTAFLVARPDDGRPSGPAQDILGALGIRDNVVVAKGTPGQHSKLAVVWLAAHRTRTVIVSSPQPLKDESLREYAQLAVAAGSNLLLACDVGHARSTAERLRCWGAEQTPWHAAIGALPPAQAPSTTVDAPDPVEWDRRVTLPRSDFTLFRDACRRLLPPNEFDPLDLLYTQTARRVLADPRAPMQEHIFEALNAEFDRSPNLDHCITVLRATQAALFRRGWLLGADLGKVITRLTHENRKMPLTDTHWRSLRAYRSPARSAACALAASGYGTGDSMRLTLADAAETASLMLSVNALALPYLRAQRLNRYGEGAKDNELLFDSTRTALSNALKDARRTLGLQLASHHISSADRRGNQQNMFGFSLLDITPRKRVK